jgi:hypothetical protein|tara:strand:+ start:3336 stop:4298 length:963 start_codon:yes stop_codon:yes gene_type:complete
MSKGGGDSSPQTVVQTNLPEYVQPYLERIISTGENIIGTKNPDGTFSMKPRERYGEYVTDEEGNEVFNPYKRIADESDYSKRAKAGIESLLTAGSPYYSEGMDLTRDALSKLGSPTSFTDSGVMSTYMSPYMEAVIKNQKSGLMSDFERDRVKRADRALKASAFGGSRAAVQEGMAQKDLMSKLLNVETEGRQKAYEDALRQYNLEQERYRGDLGDVITGSKDLIAMGEASTSDAYRQLNELEELGLAERKREQLELDQDYRDFLADRDYSKEQLAYLSDLIRGTPMGKSQETFVSSDPVAQVLGAGITASQIKNAFSGN